jgi:hypothetical protein
LTCLIIGLTLHNVAQDYQAPLVNLLFALGFVGAGSFLSTLLVVFGAFLLFKD